MKTPRTVNGIPRNFLDSEAEWVAWQNRVAAFEAETRAAISELSRILSSSQVSLSKNSKARMDNLLSGHELLLKTAESILPEFHPFDMRLEESGTSIVRVQHP